MNVRVNSSFIKTNYSSYYSPTRGKYSPWDENHAVHVISEIYAPSHQVPGLAFIFYTFSFSYFLWKVTSSFMHEFESLLLCYRYAQFIS